MHANWCVCVCVCLCGMGVSRMSFSRSQYMIGHALPINYIRRAHLEEPGAGMPLSSSLGEFESNVCKLLI